MQAPGALKSQTLNTIVGLIYDSIGADKQGRASAAALILFVIIFIVTQINLKVGKNAKISANKMITKNVTESEEI